MQNVNQTARISVFLCLLTREYGITTSYVGRTDSENIPGLRMAFPFASQIFRTQGCLGNQDIAANHTAIMLTFVSNFQFAEHTISVMETP